MPVWTPCFFKRLNSNCEIMVPYSSFATRSKWCLRLRLTFLFTHCQDPGLLNICVSGPSQTVKRIIHKSLLWSKIPYLQNTQMMSPNVYVSNLQKILFFFPAFLKRLSPWTPALEGTFNVWTSSFLRDAFMSI